MSTPRTDLALRAAAGLTLAGLACVLYGVLVERHWYRRQAYRLKILPPAARPVTILHLSDLHMTRRDESKRRLLASLEPGDLTVLTGDLLGEAEAVETVVRAIRPLRGRLGSYFVLGSNDYFRPRPYLYTNYFHRGRRRRTGIPGRGADLVRQLEADGWVHLRNRRTSLELDGSRFEVLGLDDPHIERHDLRVAGRRDETAFGLAVVHSPDPAPELAALGYDLILAGHTHGGQVRMPLFGALVTNSHLPTRLCMGLSEMPPARMHVSPGLGSSRFAPFRFLCRPEATYLELSARPPEPAAASKTRS